MKNICINTLIFLGIMASIHASDLKTLETDIKRIFPQNAEGYIIYDYTIEYFMDPTVDNAEINEIIEYKIKSAGGAKIENEAPYLRNNLEIMYRGGFHGPVELNLNIKKNIFRSDMLINWENDRHLSIYENSLWQDTYSYPKIFSRLYTNNPYQSSVLVERRLPGTASNLPASTAWYSAMPPIKIFGQIESLKISRTKEMNKIVWTVYTGLTHKYIINTEILNKKDKLVLEAVEYYMKKDIIFDEKYPGGYYYLDDYIEAWDGYIPKIIHHEQWFICANNPKKTYLKSLVTLNLKELKNTPVEIKSSFADLYDAQIADYTFDESYPLSYTFNPNLTDEEQARISVDIFAKKTQTNPFGNNSKNIEPDQSFEHKYYYIFGIAIFIIIMPTYYLFRRIFRT